MANNGDNYYIFKKHVFEEEIKRYLKRKKKWDMASGVMTIISIILVLINLVWYYIDSNSSSPNFPISPYFWIISITIVGLCLVYVVIKQLVDIIHDISNKKYTEEYIFNKIKMLQEKSHDYTAIFIIKHIDSSAKLLVSSQEAWACYMLPYYKVAKGDISGIKIGEIIDSLLSRYYQNSISKADKKRLYHSISKALRKYEEDILYSIRKDTLEHNNLKELQEIINHKYPGVDFKIQYMEKLDLNNEIKKKPSNDQIMKFSYRFYYLSTDYSFQKFQQRFVTNAQDEKYFWKSLVDLKKHLETMKSNSDVVLHLSSAHSLDELPESFAVLEKKAVNLPDELKVIWNITKSCYFNCKFCATQRQGIEDNEELSFKQRITIATELNKINHLKLDFAGGDPLYNESTRDVIYHITNYIIDKDKVCITTTGRSLAAQKIEYLEKLSTEYDVSYDYPSTWCDIKHRDVDYNGENFKQIQRLKSYGMKLNILITLSDNNTNSEVVNLMIDELSEVKPENITLLRLMPVGKQTYNGYPKRIEDYNPDIAIKAFKEKFGNKTKLHCAFRACSDDNDEKCNMLKEKIGVDHLGNVFACAWAGYLPIENYEENPFYIGNILNDGGIEVLFKSPKYRRLKDKIADCNKQFCKIFSYYGGAENGSDGLSTNNDEFSKTFKKILK